MDQALGMFFAHQVAMKMYHFQTTSAAAHKAVDAYSSTFAANFDKFMEVYQGEFGTVETSKLSINVTTVNDKTVRLHLDKVVEFMRGLEVDGEALPTEISAIRDEMIAELQKLKYLLTFK